MMIAWSKTANKLLSALMMIQITIAKHTYALPGAHLVNEFSIVIQIRWKIDFSVTPY